MNDVLHLVTWKMRLTWRMYTRNTLASVESLLFFLVFILWLGLSVWLMVFITKKAFNFIVPTLVFCDLFSLIFLLWFIIPLAGYRTNETYNLSRLKIFPLPVWKVFLANLIGSFTDISVLLPLSGFLAVFFAAGYPLKYSLTPVLLILALLFLLVLAAMTLVNILYILLPKLNMVSVAMVAAGCVLIWVVLINIGAIPHPAQTMNFFVFFRSEGVEFFEAFPTGQISIAINAYLHHDYEEMTGPLRGFTYWTAGVLVLNYLLIAYLWEMDPAGKSVIKHRAGPDPVSAKLEQLGETLSPLFGWEAMALFKKDMLEFATRSPYFFLYKILPGSIAPMIILIAMRWNLENMAFTLPKPEYASTLLIFTVLVVLFIMIGQGILFAGNQFGFEGEMIKNLLTFPTPRRSILLGKNLFLGSLFLIDSLVLSFLMLLYNLSAFTFFAWFSLLVTLFLLVLSLGNFTSVIWPYWMPLDKPSFTFRTTVILGFVNLGMTVTLAFAFTPALLLVLGPHFLGSDLVAFLLMPVAVLYGILFHNISLGPAVKLFESNEFLVLRRIADREQL